MSLGHGRYFRKVPAMLYSCLLPQLGQISHLQTEVSAEVAEKVKWIFQGILRKSEAEKTNT